MVGGAVRGGGATGEAGGGAGNGGDGGHATQGGGQDVGHHHGAHATLLLLCERTRLQHGWDNGGKGAGLKPTRSQLKVGDAPE